MKKNFVGINEIGEFQIVSGSVEITDPCYQPNSGSGVIVDNVKNGYYISFTEIIDTGSWGGRNSKLFALNKEYAIKKGITKDNLDQLDWLENQECFGVDSGQGGIFDFNTFPGGNNEEFYDECCSITLNGLGAHSLKYGVVSSSGYGYGGYEFLSIKDNTEIVGFCIIFINENENEDEDELND